MPYRISLAQPAVVDIDQTVEFIAASSPSAAARWLDDIQKAIESLEEMPLRAAKIPEASLFRFEYRHLLYRSHRIVFRVDEAANVVFVVRVYHTARAPLQMEELT